MISSPKIVPLGIVAIAALLAGCSNAQTTSAASTPEPTYTLKVPMRLYNTCTNISQNITNYGLGSMHSQMLPVGTKIVVTGRGWTQVSEDASTITYGEDENTLRVRAGNKSGCFDFGAAEDGGPGGTADAGMDPYIAHVLPPYAGVNAPTKVVDK